MPARDQERRTADAELARADPALGALIARQGPVDPFGWPGDRFGTRGRFDGLALHLVAQQISTTAALAIWTRLRGLLGGSVTPAALAAVDVAQLRAVGTSGAKARALHELALDVLEGRLDLEHLDDSGDDAVRASLLARRGIGPWSASMFMLHELRRPDVFPAGDVGLRRAIARLDGLGAPPSEGEAERRAQVWRPWRSYAAAHLWQSLRVTSQ